ncbi:MAG: hypothetical protein NTY19_43825 [Planctomycetota bacterium]|nr:hypothetical protein [Planctomycetota bacterium]
MDNYREKRFAGQRALCTREFWNAFLLVFNHYIIWELANFCVYPEGRRPPQEIVDAVRLLDSWRDVVNEEGWAEEE